MLAMLNIPVELKVKYLRRRIGDIKKLRASLESEDFSLAVKLGHQVRGNAETFDVPEMAVLAKQIEDAGHNKDKALLLHLITKMESMIKSAQLQYAQ